MTLPGWTAEASLYTTTRPFDHAPMTAGVDGPAGVRRPQVCDAECRREWILACSDLTGSRYAQCVRAGRRFCC
jgi:hypothetical protein